MTVEEFVYRSIMDFEKFIVNNEKVEYKDIKNKNISWFGIEEEKVRDYETVRTIYTLTLGLEE